VLLRHTENTVANLSLRPLRLSTQVFTPEYYKAVASLPVRRTWMAGGTVQI
ncbi:cyclopropane-fatty-acyl-phospholipid synthase domain protein, partial [Vibrio parahaemolyticus AQ3810]